MFEIIKDKCNNNNSNNTSIYDKKKVYDISYALKLFVSVCVCDTYVSCFFFNFLNIIFDLQGIFRCFFLH